MGAIGSERAIPSDPGAVRVVADSLDPDQFAEAVTRAKPSVTVHRLTASGAINPVPRHESWSQRVAAA